MGSVLLILVIFEFCFNLIFFMEILVRILGAGFLRYFSSVMNVLDILVVLTCSAIEFYYFYTNDPRLAGYASLLFPFRLWYVIRVIDQKNKSRDLRVFMPQKCMRLAN